MDHLALLKHLMLDQIVTGNRHQALQEALTPVLPNLLQAQLHHLLLFKAPTITTGNLDHLQLEALILALAIKQLH
jgi:hypothetical protein